MNIYLAGGLSGNLSKLFKSTMQVHLASPLGKSTWQVHLASIITEGRLRELLLYLAGEHPVKNGKDMKLYLAGENGEKKICHDLVNSKDEILPTDINILESFYYLRNNTDFCPLFNKFGSFLLDSGAFTFMAGSHKGKVDWDAYTEEYAAFINKWNIELFFELDIDSIVGLQEVERLRFKLETLTGKKPIPVWHKSRGKDYFIKMCKNYPYVALGGIVTKEIPKELYEKLFPWFIQTAHKNGCKIHGLGYTVIANLPKFHFDSVDSTAWLYGNRGGYLYIFRPQTGKIDKLEKSGNVRLKSHEAAQHNFIQWCKLVKYANIKW